MSISDIPVRVVGPGSQPEIPDGDKLSYIDMPSDMQTFMPPLIPEPEEVRGLVGAREAMRWLKEALGEYQTDAVPRIASINSLNKDCRELVNQILGEGEVSVTLRGNPRAVTQEAVLAGVWRTLYLDDQDEALCDVLEVADIPHTIRNSDENFREINTSADCVSNELANALPILIELESHCARYRPGVEAHAINLSLLPLSNAELEFLDERLGRGPVDVLSRAYGKCQIISTKTENVWWVRYYNSMGVLILNMLEVVDVPSVVAAAPEDLVDSADRLAQIIEPYWAENFR